MKWGSDHEPPEVQKKPHALMLAFVDNGCYIQDNPSYPEYKVLYHNE